MNYDYFEEQIKNCKLHHAYLMVGKYCDKKKIARQIIDKVGSSLADAFIIYKEENILIGEIRELRKSLAMAPFNSKLRMAIIYPAEKMTIESQNALLKNIRRTSEGLHFIFNG